MTDRDYASYQLSVDVLSDKEIDLMFNKVDDKING